MRILKLSLAASVALCALSTASFAQPLEEAIKGVDVSGVLRYRYTDDRYDNAGHQKDAGPQTGTSQHEWRAEAIFKTPVVDALSMNFGVRYDNKNTVNHAKGADVPGVGVLPYLGTGLGAGYDGSAGVSVFHLNITPESTATNIMIGKQYLGTPITDAEDGDRGTGILALNSDVPGLTVAAGAFDSWSTDNMGKYGLRNNYSVDKNIYVLAAIYGADLGEAGNIGVQGWFFNVTDIFKYIGFIQLDYSISVVKFALQYALSSIDNGAEGGLDDVYNGLTSLQGPAGVANRYYTDEKANIADKNDLLDVMIGVDLASIDIPLTAKLGYITNFGDGTIVSVDDEGSFNKAGAIWWQNSATLVSLGAFASYGYTPYNASKDLSVIYANVAYGIPIADKTLGIGVDFVYGTNKISDIPAATFATDGATTSIKKDFMEITPKITYAHSQKLKFQLWYAMLDTKDKSDGVENSETEKRNRFRVEAKYSF